MTINSFTEAAASLKTAFDDASATPEGKAKCTELAYVIGTQCFMSGEKPADIAQALGDLGSELRKSFVLGIKDLLAAQPGPSVIGEELQTFVYAEKLELSKI